MNMGCCERVNLKKAILPTQTFFFLTFPLQHGTTSSLITVLQDPHIQAALTSLTTCISHDNGFPSGGLCLKAVK